jgi:hypothetical protein
MLCSRKLRLRRARPTVGLHSGHRTLLGLRRLYAVGAKICSYRGGFDDRDGAATSFSCAKSAQERAVPGTR